MSDYLTSYTNRMIRNEQALLKLADEVIEADPTIEVYVHRDSRIKHITFFKNEQTNSIVFHELPYHWSGCGVREHFGNDDDLSMPFTVEDVLTTFHPITDNLFRQPNEYFKSKEHFLKIYSFYKRYEKNG